MLQVLKAYRTPEERFEISPFLTAMFQAISNSGVVARLNDFMACRTNSELQFYAVSSLALIAPGPRIAQTPIEAMFHPNQMFFKKLVLGQAGALDKILVLLDAVVESEDKVLYHVCFMLPGPLCNLSFATT